MIHVGPAFCGWKQWAERVNRAINDLGQEKASVADAHRDERSLMALRIQFQALLDHLGVEVCPGGEIKKKGKKA